MEINSQQVDSLATRLHQAEGVMIDRKENGLTRKEIAITTGIVAITLMVAGLALKKMGASNAGIGVSLTLLTGVGVVLGFGISDDVKDRAEVEFKKLCEEAVQMMGNNKTFTQWLAKQLNDLGATESIKELTESSNEFEEAIDSVQKIAQPEQKEEVKKPKTEMKTNSILQGEGKRFGDLTSLAPENIIG